MKQNKFYFTQRLKTFGYAFNGLRILLSEEPNAWIHTAAALCAITAGLVLRISSMEWLAIILCIGLVLALELVNTAIENVMNFVSPQKHDAVKRIKDLSAAAVLVAAMCSFVVGLVIFIPKILNLC